MNYYDDQDSGYAPQSFVRSPAPPAPASFAVGRPRQGGLPMIDRGPQSRDRMMRKKTRGGLPPMPGNPGPRGPRNPGPFDPGRMPGGGSVEAGGSMAMPPDPLGGVPGQSGRYGGINPGGMYSGGPFDQNGRSIIADRVRAAFESGAFDDPRMEMMYPHAFEPIG